MWSVGTVRVWHREQGWGVIDAPETPGGCWAHFSHLWNEETPPAGPEEAVTGDFVELSEGETVDFKWERPGQDGYEFAAVTVRARGRPVPSRRVIRLRTDSGHNPDT